MSESTPDAGMFYTYEAYMALLERYAGLKGACHHCWHTLHTTQMCCWCGISEGPQHGPFAPKGDS